MSKLYNINILTENAKTLPHLLFYIFIVYPFVDVIPKIWEVIFYVEEIMKVKGF